MWDDKKFVSALFFALNAHNDQKMIYPSGMPYSAHIYGVLSYAVKYNIMNDNLDWNVITQVSLLHDVLEDTPITYDQLLESFGKTVADGVQALSKNKELPMNERIADCIERIIKLSPEIAIVKLADRLFNMRGKVPFWSKDKQIAYKNEAIMISNRLGFVSANLKNALDKAISDY